MLRRGTATILATLTATVASACAHGGGRPDAVQAVGSAGQGVAMCTLRVRSGYDLPVDAGVQAGAERHALGTLEPGHEIELGVPCSFEAVTVYRIVHSGSGSVDQWIRPLSHALEPHGVTTVTLQPATTRGPAARHR